MSQEPAADAPVVHREAPTTQERIRLVMEALGVEGGSDLAASFSEWPVQEVAAVLEALPQNQRRKAWELVPAEQQGDVLIWLGDQARVSLLTGLSLEDAIAATATMTTPELAEVVDEVPRNLGDAILESLATDERAAVEDALSVPEDSAGRLMRREWVAVRADVSLEVVKRYLQSRGALPEHTRSLMVVDREKRYLGKLGFVDLLTRNQYLTVEEVMEEGAEAVSILTPLDAVTLLFQRRDLLSLPVLDDEGRLVGRIVVEDVIPLIREEAERPMMQMAGLEVDEDLLAPIAISARRRMFWLGINLATAFLAAWVIGNFEATLEKIVALAVLMPIVASMGGIAGSQTLTLVIRGMALEQVTNENTRWLVLKELAISAINGVVWAVVVGVIAWLWFGQYAIGLILGAAMLISLVVAATSGLAIPLVLKRLGLDPALSGSVVLTTVTDVVGFLSFLGLATIFLL